MLPLAGAAADRHAPGRRRGLPAHRGVACLRTRLPRCRDAPGARGWRCARQPAVRRSCPARTAGPRTKPPRPDGSAAPSGRGFCRRAGPAGSYPQSARGRWGADRRRRHGSPVELLPAARGRTDDPNERRTIRRLRRSRRCSGAARARAPREAHARSTLRRRVVEGCGLGR